MAEKTEAKTDSEKLDKVLGHLDSVHRRMDAADEERKADRSRLDAVCTKMDADDKSRKDEKEEDEKKKADAARKDAEDKEKDEKAKADAAKADAAKADAAKADAARKDAEEEEKKKADATRGDSQASKKLQEQIDALARRMPPEFTPEIRQRMAGFQTRAEHVYQAVGDSAGAPPPNQGESEIDYRVRLMSKYQTHAKNAKIKNAKLGDIKDASALEVFEDAIYADALDGPSEVTAGVLIPQRIKDAAGREITRYKGDPNACWDQFNPPYRHVRRLVTPGSSRVN
jgi:hypothetical protein